MGMIHKIALVTLWLTRRHNENTSSHIVLDVIMDVINGLTINKYWQQAWMSYMDVIHGIALLTLWLTRRSFEKTRKSCSGCHHGCDQWIDNVFFRMSHVDVTHGLTLPILCCPKIPIGFK